MTKKKRRAWRRKRGLKGSEGTEPEALPLTLLSQADTLKVATTTTPFSCLLQAADILVLGNSLPGLQSRGAGCTA